MDKNLRLLVEQHDGILLEHPDKGFLVSDRLGRSFFCDADIQSPSASADVLLDILTKPDESGFDEKEKEQLSRARKTMYLKIHISADAFFTPGSADAVARIIKICRQNKLDIIFDLPNGPDNWKDFWTYLDVLCSVEDVGFRAILQSIFSSDEEIMHRLFQYRIMLQWPLGLRGEASLEELIDYARPNDIRSFAEFGIPVSYAFYVHRANIQYAKESLKKLLPEGLYSGFSVIPCFQNPTFSSLQDTNSHSDFAGEYLSLLVELYKEFPHYDIMFYPINSLADVVAHGGWNEETGSPRFLQMLIAGDGSIKLFRQIPDGAFQWTTCSELLQKNEEVLKNEFNSVIARELAKKHQKESCHLLSICACTEGMSCQNNSQTEFVCAYRKMFIEAFLWQKFMLKQMIQERISRQEEQQEKTRQQNNDA